MAIQFKQVSASYGSHVVLHDLDFNISFGESVAVVGPNGSGKSTLLKTLAGLVSGYTGSLTVEGIEVRDLGPKDVSKQIAFVPQSEPTLFPFTALELTLMGRLPHSPGFLDRPDDVQIAERCLEEADALMLRNRPTTQLSGGELQRVWLARALAQESKILLLDEPTAHLDIQHALQFVGTIRKLRNRGVTTIAAVHDLNLAVRFADRVLVVKEGRLLSDTSAQDLDFRSVLPDAFGVSFHRVEDQGETWLIPRSNS